MIRVLILLTALITGCSHRPYSKRVEEIASSLDTGVYVVKHDTVFIEGKTNEVAVPFFYLKRDTIIKKESSLPLNRGLPIITIQRLRDTIKVSAECPDTSIITKSEIVKIEKKSNNNFKLIKLLIIFAIAALLFMVVLFV